jgi:hypothetical protein
MSRTNQNHQVINRIISGLSRSLFQETTTALRRTLTKVATGAVVLGLLTASLPTPSFAAKVASASEATPEERAACTSDAFRLCSSAIPSVDRVVACLKSEKSKLSPLCRAAMQRASTN